MVKFLLHRPIAVLMTFLALVIAGSAMFMAIPVSLLPDIDIPRITVKASDNTKSAREMENLVVAPLRRQLMQVGGLREIRSETTDGSGNITLDLDYGIDSELAFIEANEKIDATMSVLPKDTPRPKVVKSSVTNIPVVYLNMYLRTDSAGARPDPSLFHDMGEIARSVISRRLEQLPQIAMVDITGVPQYHLKVTPDQASMAEAGVTIDDLRQALTSNNVSPGNLKVRQGFYVYSINIPNSLSTAADVEAIYLRKNGRVMQLRDICRVSLEPQASGGISTYNGRQCITLAIVKHSGETMGSFQEALQQTMEYFSDLYPEIEFATSRSQTELLDYSISNLKTNLLIGLLLVFVTCWLFMGDHITPLVVSITIIIAIILTFLVFYLLHVSINIISLAGLILATGMMIDNSVIVTENISQYRLRGYNVEQSCVNGTNEIITPMLSSSLTTIAVFVPLVFMSGIAGAIFTDQALSISAGLACSYVVGITLLPVLYKLLCKKRKSAPRPAANHSREPETRLSRWLLRGYDKGIDWVFSHKSLCIAIMVLTIPLGVFTAYVIPIAGVPEISGTECVVRIGWGENISVEENLRRVNQLMSYIGDNTVEHSAYVGTPDFLLDNGVKISNSECEIYIRTASSEDLWQVADSLEAKVKNLYPMAEYSLGNPGTMFDRIFVTDEPHLEAHVFNTANAAMDYSDQQRIGAVISDISGGETALTRGFPQIVLKVDREKLLLYNVDFQQVQRALSTAFQGNTVTTLKSNQRYLPIEIKLDSVNLTEILNSTMITAQIPEDVKSGTTGRTKKNDTPAIIPLGKFITVSQSTSLRKILAGNGGEYIPYGFSTIKSGEIPATIQKVTEKVKADKNLDVVFSGTFFTNSEMLRQLLWILAVSVILIYFILCAQFESFLQPLIVLLEIPFDTIFALLALWICGESLNVMSAIGIIVTAGIVVNDSILKLDAINELRKSGMPLMEAIHTAGSRRLRAIVMTSLTTIVAMIPILFTNDIGSQLQRPLAIAMISSMIVGTAVSIFIIPLIYWMIYKSRKPHTNAA